MSDTTARLEVVAAGPLVSLQDAGRFGTLRFGVPASGPMDRFAHAAANAAVGNPFGATAIEVSLGGIELVCRSHPVTVAVTGGGFRVDVDDTTVADWAVAVIEPGDRLRVRPGRWGSWAYVAVAGELDAPTWLGSTATHSPSGRGGGLVGAGDTVSVAAPRVEPGRVGSLLDGGAADVDRDDDPLRVVLGPQQRHFDPIAIERLRSESFRLTNAYDRMGVRLDGPPLPLGDALSIPSEPIVRGSIQVAGDGVATVLLADHQTTGGYPKIATVLSGDVDRLVQHRAGDTVTFEAVTPVEAVDIARDRARRVDAALAAIGRRDGNLAARLATMDLIGHHGVGSTDRPDG